MTKKKNKTKIKAKVNEGKATTPVVNDQEDKPFDFGGLPARDLKKNLGCG